MAPKKRQKKIEHKPLTRPKTSAPNEFCHEISSIAKCGFDQRVNVEGKIKLEVLENCEKPKDMFKSEPVLQVGGSDSIVLNEGDLDRMPWQSFACTPSQLRLDIVL